MKKILFISPLPPPNYGSAMSSQMCLDILKNSKEFKVENIKINFAKDISSMGKLSFSKISSTLKLKNEIKKKIKVFNPNLVYFMPATAKIGMLRDFLLVREVKLHKLPIIFHIRTRVNSKNFFLKKMFLGEKAILLSDFFKKEVSWAFTENEIVVLNNAIPNEVSEAEFKRILKNRKERKSLNLLFLSNMDLAKGWLKLLRACKVLEDKGINFKCNFVGEWPSSKEKKIFRKEVERLNLSKQVKYLGGLRGEEKSNVFKESDIFVFPTEYSLETFGRVAVEAMMFGLPVIASKTGSLQEIVSNKKSGFILEKNTSEAIAEKVIFLGDKNLREKMGEQGRKLFLEKFEITSYKKRFVKIIKEASKI